jgi:hypothetical protein
MGVGAGGFLKGDISEKNTAEMGRWAIFRIRSNDRPVLGTAFGQNPEFDSGSLVRNRFFLHRQGGGMFSERRILALNQDR